MTLTSSYQYIGRTGAVSCDAGWKYYVLLYAKTSGSTSTGKHTVTVLMRLACDRDSTFYGYYTSGSAKVNGVSAISWSGSQVPNSAWNKTSLTVGGYTYLRWIDLKEGSAVIDTGYAAKDVAITASWSRNSTSGTRPSWLPYTTEITASVNVTLPVIASASKPTVSASSVTMGNNVTITTNRNSDSLTHDLTYSFGGSTGTIATGVGASYVWKVPDLASKIPNKSSGTCTITCTTKSGSTAIGTSTVSITLNIPAKSAPTTSASTVKMGTSVTINTNRSSSAYTHTLSYTIGSKSGTIATGVTTSKAWTPDKSLASYTGNNTSATCTITCNTYNGTLLVGTATKDITLTVPDATVPKLSASTVAMGSKVTITLNEEASVYTHSLTYTMKEYGGSTVHATGNITSHNGGSYEWTVPLSLAAKIPSKTNATIEVSCKTLIGTNQVGTVQTASFTATVPDNSTTKPKVAMTAVAVDTPFEGVYVAGKSKVKVSYTATSDYSTIKSYSTALSGSSGTTNPYTSTVLSSAGTVTINGKVTDARGYYTTTSSSITVIDYSRPRIIPGQGKSSIVCTRCNSNGTIDPGGVYLRIQIGRDYRKVISNGVQKNFCQLSYQWKTDAQGDSSYSDPKVLLEKKATYDYVDVILADIVTSNITAYDIRLIVEDDVGERDTVTITVPTAFVTWHVPEEGHGFTLGGYHDPSKKDVFDCQFDAEFNGNVSGTVFGLGKLPQIPEDSDFNDYKSFGVWAVYGPIINTLTNIPVQTAGTLRVWSAIGNGDISGDNAYIMQEYIPYDNSTTYRRSIKKLAGVWDYGPWKYNDGWKAL